MKINHVIVGILIVLAFLAGRWFPGNPSAPPAGPAIAGAGLRTQPSPITMKSLNQPPSASNAPVPPLPDNPMIVPSLPQPPLPDKPEVVRNTGPFIDPDPRKSTTTYMGPDRSVRNTGEYIDPGLPTGSNR